MLPLQWNSAFNNQSVPILYWIYITCVTYLAYFIEFFCITDDLSLLPGLRQRQGELWVQSYIVRLYLKTANEQWQGQTNNGRGSLCVCVSLSLCLCLSLSLSIFLSISLSWELYYSENSPVYRVSSRPVPTTW